MTPIERIITLLTFVTLSLVDPFRSLRVLGQFAQQYQVLRVTTGPNAGDWENQFWWQPTIFHQPQRVATTNPKAVILEYNCAYMKEICKNAKNFYGGLRGPGSATNLSAFGYDMDTGDGSRHDQRRTMSCPRNWKRHHTCPETDQVKPMRHDGEWPHSDLDPSRKKDALTIRHKRDQQGNIIEESKITYSCDEFPAASWVEGGTGISIPGLDKGYPEGSSETRCAALRCSDRGVRGVKAEQNWQAEAHGKLRTTLLDLVEEEKNADPTNQRHATFDKDHGIVMFLFRMTNQVNGVAATVYTYENNVIHNQVDVSQAKRGLEADPSRDPIAWLNSIDTDKLKKAGNYTAEHVYADPDRPGVRRSNMAAMTRPQFGPAFDLDLESRSSYDELQLEEDDQALNLTYTPLFSRAVASDLAQARQLVNDALAKSAKLNKARLDNPSRNKYRLRPGTLEEEANVKRSDGELGKDDENGKASRLLTITDDMVDAAAIVSEADAVEFARGPTERAVVSRGNSFWMEKLKRKGTVPWADDPDYKVFRNVRDFGAVGNGLADDTKAIKRALLDGRRCGEKCHGSTTKNAIIYFPPGTYRVSSTIPLPFGTQVIGDANKRPTILASQSFIGLGVLSTNEYTGNGFGIDGNDQQYYINTANFYRQIRNLKIDISQVKTEQRVVGLHYQVAQATSLQNIELIAAKGSNQIGIFAENGSGGVISDVVFRGGAFGLYGGTQQFTAQRLKFDGCATGVQIIWDWGWVWKSINMSNVDVGFRLLREGVTEEGHVGSASFVDSSFSNVSTAILVAPPKREAGSASTGIVLDNVVFEKVERAVAGINGATLLEVSPKVEYWVLGPVYSPAREFSWGSNTTSRPHRRQAGLLDSDGAFFERAKPQYGDRMLSEFVHLTDFGAKGDGRTDDTEAFQQALWYSQGKVLFVDAGSYILTKTVVVPLGTKLVGEAWSQLVASGSYFQNAKKPKAMLQVGRQGDVGSIEMQDLLLTSRGPTAGLIVIEWNVKAEKPGSAGLWDCHVRLGGAVGTNLTADDCPAGGHDPNPKCKVASLMMHITRKASGYFENMWLWAADHMIDDKNLDDANNTMIQTSIYAARGLLVESTEPTWLYGTSSEHSVFYQYKFNGARNVFAAMIQSESPYFQPKPQAPSPFNDAVGALPGDPDYNQTAGVPHESWALVMRKSADVLIAGAGLYSWSASFDEDCVDQQACQKGLVLLENNFANVKIQSLVTIGTENMVVQEGFTVSALDNLHVQTHPRWSYIANFDVGGNTTEPHRILNVNSRIWDMDKPQITVSSGTWTSTITEPPITITNWAFEVLTVTQPDAKLGKRDDVVTGLRPFFASTPEWPIVTYTLPGGTDATAVPGAEFPVPPAIFGDAVFRPP
ncbi:hypothetical protein FALCPG4_015007 [Fusarium falciforme]